MQRADWVKGWAQPIRPSRSTPVGCMVPVDPDVMGRLLDRGYRANASMLAKIEHMEVRARIIPSPSDAPVDLGDAWEGAPRPDRKPIRGPLVITGCVQWSNRYPRDRHDPSRGFVAGSEDQDPATCDGCGGETRPGFECLRCLPHGPERARKADKEHRAAHARAERAASRRRNGRRFEVRSHALTSACVDEY